MMEETQRAKEVAAMYEVEAVNMPEPKPQPNRDRTAEDLKAQMAAQGVHLSDRDMEVVQAYLASEQRWAGLYRRLADA